MKHKENFNRNIPFTYYPVSMTLEPPT